MQTVTFNWWASAISLINGNYFFFVAVWGFGFSLFLSFYHLCLYEWKKIRGSNIHPHTLLRPEHFAWLLNNHNSGGVKPPIGGPCCADGSTHSVPNRCPSPFATWGQNLEEV